MTAPTARESDADRARAVVDSAWGPDEHWTDVPIERLRRLQYAIVTALRAERAAGWKEALKRAASIVENVPHSCVSDEHCCALHEAHKRAAAGIRALAARGEEEGDERNVG